MKLKLDAFWRPQRRSDRLHAFIVTYARSGSTLLQKVLASIPDCHFNGENNDALAGLWASFRSASLTKCDQGAIPRTRDGDPWRGAHLINPERYNRHLAQAFVEEILHPPARARIIGFKEVRYFDHEDDLPDYLDYVRMTFHPALLIFNRRNPADVAKSAWWRHHPSNIEAEVRNFNGKTDLYVERHPKETVIVNYEDYCVNVESLRPLFERLSAKFDPDNITGLMLERLNH